MRFTARARGPAYDPARGPAYYPDCGPAYYPVRGPAGVKRSLARLGSYVMVWVLARSFGCGKMVWLMLKEEA
ncbi:hypothetical protein QS713_02040 [Gleimia hominis]|uniref:Uncharacterized protein n=1 Tax=Gleimia hominis TaxID=595468 RepID=A0ABU3I8Z3_9ACTO|nr:hypothetical protein [Gleimia hominis]MDT3766844.1 hypothetical protein [Gleimia hominis]